MLTGGPTDAPATQRVSEIEDLLPHSGIRLVVQDGMRGRSRLAALDGWAVVRLLRG